MVGIYFSGTGNSKYCLEAFLKAYDATSHAFSIEDKKCILHIKQAEEIVISYPVQYSNIPKILYDFIIDNKDLWKGKRIFIIATMSLFSGDGCGVLSRLLMKYGAYIIGGIHLKLSDSIADERVLKRSYIRNKKLFENAEEKIAKTVHALQNGNPPQEGLDLFSHMLGLFAQRLYFFRKTKSYSSKKLKVNMQKCIRCDKCVNICPMGNINIIDNIVVSNNRCTLCYRCINQCPSQAITLLGNKVIHQNQIENYIK